MNSRLTRKLMRLAVIAAGIVILGLIVMNPASRISRKHSDRQQVIFWHMWMGEWKTVVDRITDDFNRGQSQYEVMALSLPSGADAKFLLAVAGGDPPDVMAQWNSVIPTWASRGVIIPLDSLMTPAELAEFKRTCFPVIWKIGTFRDHFYGLCVGLNIFSLYYRPSHFIEAGLDPDKPPATISQLDAMAQKLTIIAKDASIRRIGFLPSVLQMWAPSFGGGFYDETSDSLTIMTQPNLRTLEWIRGYRQRYGVQNIIRYESSFLTGASGDLDWPFITGGYSIVLDGQWRVAQLARYAPKLDYRTAPLPAADEGEREKAGFCSGNFMIIPRGAKCPKGAWEFMKHWAGVTDPANAAKFYTWGGWMPINQAIVDSPDFQQYLKEHPQFRAFVDTLPSPNLQVAPPVTYQNFFMDRLTQMADRVMRLSQTPEQGLQSFRREIETEQKRTSESGHE
ncbi:MAG: ABC transporter substrate-binding protein [bacterium]|nr:ABC transporter substrate-binding protein [Candidatus Sumerlaeota bacterium]